jgi:DNA-directed RNA polymerase subunit RPC12/RpoP
MARFLSRISTRNFARADKTWNAGQLAEKGAYACRHCNAETILEQRGTLPLCPSCSGRRFSLM